MSLLASLSVGQMAVQATSWVARPLVAASSQFVDLLQGTEDTVPAGESSPGLESQSLSVADLAAKINERVAAIAQAFPGLLTSPIQLNTSAMGNIYADGEHPQLADFESRLDQDDQLGEWLGKWRGLTGKSEFNFEPPATGSASA